jgi:hypothetical protein
MQLAFRAVVETVRLIWRRPKDARMVTTVRPKVKGAGEADHHNDEPIRSRTAERPDETRARKHVDVDADVVEKKV